jgi:ATP-binding cassette subfamily B (MDR/TAP) protein 1
MQDGIGEKMSIFVYLITSFVTAIIVSFLNGWKLTLVVISCAPVIIVAQSVVAKVLRSIHKQLIFYRCKKFEVGVFSQNMVFLK